MTPPKEIAAALRAGASADIWFDASSYPDEEVAEKKIEETQTAMENAARILDRYDRAMSLIDTIARMTNYSVDSSDDKIEDAFATMNNLIRVAKEITA